MTKNRQIVFVAMLFTLLYGVTEAQTMKAKFGVKAGVNIANVSDDPGTVEFSSSMKADFHAGIVFNLHWGFRDELSGKGTGYFGLQPEVLFSRQGFAFNNKAINLNYICVPLLAKLYATKELSIEAGPYMGYLMSTEPGNTVIEGTEIKLEDLTGGLDAGAAIGLGYEMKNDLFFNARYNLGLSDVAGNLAWKNNVVAISVGWLFNL